MPLDELARLMQILGARTAINLDGGGSSTLVSLDEKTGEWLLRNKPSGKQERAVANAWIVVKH
jgi:exopolysaccharide biosynthesis protein